MRRTALLGGIVAALLLCGCGSPSSGTTGANSGAATAAAASAVSPQPPSNWRHATRDELSTGTVLIHVQGDPRASNNPDTWQTVAVLQLVGGTGQAVSPGFLNGDNVQVWRKGAEQLAEGTFRMKVGPGDVNFFALPQGGGSPVRLELVAVTTKDDPHYQHVRLFE